MTIDSLRQYALFLLHATENIQWGDDLVFKVGGKMFAFVNLDASSPGQISFKCTPEKFAELTERDGVIPAPYAARYHWVLLEHLDALPTPEIKQLIAESYQMVFDKLPGKTKQRLAKPVSAKKKLTPRKRK